MSKSQLLGVCKHRIQTDKECSLLNTLYIFIVLYCTSTWQSGIHLLGDSRHARNSMATLGTLIKLGCVWGTSQASKLDESLQTGAPWIGNCTNCVMTTLGEPFKSWSLIWHTLVLQFFLLQPNWETSFKYWGHNINYIVTTTKICLCFVLVHIRLILIVAKPNNLWWF